MFGTTYMSATGNSYIRFLNCIKAIESKSGLDAIQKQLLDVVMVAHSQKQEILVGDLLQLHNIGSQATLHGRIKQLSADGYVRLVTDAVDGRKKKVTPTKQALKHYDSLSKFLVTAVSV